MITTNDLTVRYPRVKTPAINNLSLQISVHETVLLLGPSGGGKSTLALTLAGLIPHNILARLSGDIRIGEINPLSDQPGKTAAQVGILFQDPETSFATLVVEDEIAFGLENLSVPREEMPARIRSALNQVGLPGFHRRRLETLSGGEAQRVALAALLAMSPPVLILDEPTANLDPRATREFFEILAELKDQHTILLIEHKLDACFHLADRVILLNPDGSLLAAGEPHRVYRQHFDEIETAGIWIPESHLTKPEPTSKPVQISPLGAVKSEIPAVSVSNFSFAYPNHPSILNNLSLDIPQGDFLALVGANGSGKSTLARLIMGLLPGNQEGAIQLFGDPIETLSLTQRTDRVGYVFQNPEHQFVSDSVAEELAYSLQTHRLAEEEIDFRVEELLARFGLTAQAQQNPFTLSQGQKRRLSVGTMLASGQKLLILDEPTFGQDRRTASALMELICQLNLEGTTILMITHNMHLVKEFAKRTAVLVNGQIGIIDSPNEVFQRKDLMAQANLI